MVQLGRHFGAGPASLSEIAAAEDMPRAYLEQLAFVLRDAGLVVSTRGAHGGYQLARAPEAITMSEVLRALEGPLAPMICATEDDAPEACARTSSCTVNYLWIRVRDPAAHRHVGTDAHKWGRESFSQEAQGNDSRPHFPHRIYDS